MKNETYASRINENIKPKFAAVIVTYNPDPSKITNLIERCKNSLNWIFVVDNGSYKDIGWVKLLSSKAKLVRLQENFGIAYAQNVGISEAKALGVDALVLFDQDSDPHPDMISKLILAVDKLLCEGRKVACVGPRYLDKRQNNASPFVRLKGLRLTHAFCDKSNDIVTVDHLIASGSLIPMEALDVVGGMQDRLFIDYVDLEWCERAKSMGYQSYGVCAAKMMHELGDEPICLLGKAYPARSPLRHYYMFRNAIWLYRQGYVRWNWKIVDGLRLIRKYVFYSLFASPRHVHFWMMSKGVFHGLIGRMGKYSE